MSEKYLSDVRAVIMEQGLGKARMQILSKQLESKGGAIEQQQQLLSSGAVTHVLVGNNIKLSKVLQSLKAECLPAGVLVLRADWLSSCLVKGRKIDHVPYLVSTEIPVDHAPTPLPPPLIRDHPKQDPTRIPMLLLSPQPSSPSPSGDMEGDPHTTGLEVGVAPCQATLSMTSSSEVGNVLCPQEGGVTTSGLSNRSPQKVCACV